MIRVSLLVITAPVVLCIIVKDPPLPLTGDEYKYSYHIDDPSTGDSKSQHEVRQGDVVSGAYTVLDPDGVKRTVEYTADPKHGFRAVVTNEPGRPIPYELSPAPPADQHTLDRGPYSSYPQYVAASHDSFSLSYEPMQLQTYYSDKDTNEQPVFYFTPANEINSETRDVLAEGQYFAPTKKYQ